MESIVENVKGIMESIHLSQKRIENGTLSQKDRKNLIQMIREIMEDIDSREAFQENDKITQLKEHLGNIQDALLSQEPDRVISGQKEVSAIVDQLNYEVTFNNLIKGIFQNDDQIMQLEEEKADLAQQLIDLDMETYGEISDISRQVLEVNHIKLDAESNEQQRGNQNMDTNTAHKFVATVYLPGNQTNKESFYGTDLETVLNTIRQQQKAPNSSMANVKTVYIREQGTTGASLKYDIASGKDITPIYLKLPYAKREEFKKMTAYLKANGAVFNSHKKAWYVTREQDLSKFDAYLPEGTSKVTDVGKNVQKTAESPMKQAENLINHIEENKTVFLNDERNLIMNYAYHIQDMDKVERLANELADNAANGHKDFFQVQERVDKEIEMQTEKQYGKKEMLYGVEVPVDTSIRDSLKEITQDTFDEIMLKRVESLARHDTGMEKLDFSGCRFRGVTFDKKETGLIKEFDFSHSEFLDCHFEHAEFESSNFQNTNIYGCEIKGSDFLYCDFSNSVIEQTNDYNSSFAWCSFEHTAFKQGSFTQSVFGTPNFDHAVMDGTGFFDTTVSKPSMANLTLTVSGSSSADIAAYANRTKEALWQYEKSLSVQASTRENTGSAGRKGTVPNSLIRKLNENKVKAETANKQNQPQEAYRKSEPVK